MLKITIPKKELWDEETERFIDTPEFVVELEHSLVSLSKWESIHEKPFLGSDEKTEEEILDYVYAMFLDSSLPKSLVLGMTRDNLSEIHDYIAAAHTGTTFYESEKRRSGSSETITSELIYYWLVALEIPFEVETWNLNRLFTLVRICNIKNNPKENKMTAQQVAHRNRELNEQRKAQHKTKG